MSWSARAERDRLLVPASLGLGPVLSGSLLGLAACAGAAPPAPLEPLGLSRERVVSRGAWLDAQEVPAAYRSASTTPLVGPYYVLISYSGRYCVVDAKSYARAQDDQFWACEWHYPRPGRRGSAFR